MGVGLDSGTDSVLGRQMVLHVVKVVSIKTESLMSNSKERKPGAMMEGTLLTYEKSLKITVYQISAA